MTTIPDVLGKASEAENEGNKAEEQGGLQVRERRILAETTKVPALCFVLPMSCYGGSIILPLLDLPGAWGEVSLAQYFLLALNTVAQTLFVVKTHMITQQASETAQTSCDQLDEISLSAAVWAFVCVILTDLQQTADLCDIVVRQIPTLPATETLKYASGPDGVKLVGGGMCVLRKCVLFFVTVLPKMTFAVALLYLGVQFLVLSDDNESVILNAFALIFILQIDELLFTLFSPQRSKRFLEVVPPFIIHGLEQDLPLPWRWWQPVALPAKLLLSAVLTAVALLCFSRCGYEVSWDIMDYKPSNRTDKTEK